MENARGFKDKIRRGQVCIGTNVTFADQAVTEAICSSFDFVWIDTEHSALNLETVQGHIMATKGTETAALVRVIWNDQAFIRPVLDMGAAGVIVPMVRTADEARRAVAACRYPPEGIRGFGPRRPSNYGRMGGDALYRAVNETVMCIVQIENIDAVNNLDQILDVRGLDGIAVGPADLSISMGHIVEPGHPEVLQVIDKVLSKARRTNVLAGIAMGNDVEQAIKFIESGAQWISLGCDFSFLIETADRICGRLRAHFSDQFAEA